MSNKILTGLVISFLPFAAAIAADSNSQNNVPDLIGQEITSLSRRGERAAESPNALYIVRQRDIEESGAQNIPDLLRMVPGLQVAQSGAHNWAVTSRGFNGQFANKLLVMIDGRTVYNPVFSGTNWDTQNVMLENIERIEVIRGPGATLWGANAVNGVINIVTKSAADTVGKLATVTVGNDLRASVAARYGDVKDGVAYRSYGQYFDYNQQHLKSGGGANDQWNNGQGGFRIDTDNLENDKFTFIGDTYKGEQSTKRYLPVTSAISPTLYKAVDDTDSVSGANFSTKWKHSFAKDSKLTGQFYYDNVVRKTEYVGAAQHTQTFDFDLQHDFWVNDYNNVTYGAGYRVIDSGFGNSFYIGYTPEDRVDNLFSGFVQDNIKIIPRTLALTVGTKLEHNAYSGFEYEPSIKLSWTPSKKQTGWLSVSRAVHAPNQTNQDINLVLSSMPSSGLSRIISEHGSPNAASEVLTAYEAGYRFQHNSLYAADFAVFYNDYSKLASLASGKPSLAYDPLVGNYVNIPLIVGNANSGETHGIELAIDAKPMRDLRLHANYTIYYSHLNIIGASLVTSEGNTPKQQLNLSSYYDISKEWRLSNMLYLVERLPALNVPGYARFDTGIAYIPNDWLELRLIGQNLLQAQHVEYSPFIYQAPELIGRSVLVKASVKF